MPETEETQLQQADVIRRLLLGGRRLTETDASHVNEAAARER